MNTLAEDGRCAYDELARVAGVSEATVRRRLGALRREGRVRIRERHRRTPTARPHRLPGRGGPP
ncbi:winged helix-turn-helix transcriptional regulator [Streptomyces sp. CA-179760]|uniref:winged helix-turn-helix transcriptional regulator n=1 Tax=Streptomyces sp. CA-179760 TaxID=3240054 RepID=UPI003D8EFB6B